MKDAQPQPKISMDTLEIPSVAQRHTFYLSSCESGTGIDLQDSTKSSRNSSTSSFSSNHVAQTIDTNSFLMVLKHLHCLRLRRQKHGRYRTLSSSLHLFFKTHQHVFDNQFYKSPSMSQLHFSITGKQSPSKQSRSHHQFHLIDTFKEKTIDLTNRRTLFRTSDKIVSEDNNTNTMSSLDLATIPPTLLITDTNSSSTAMQQILSNHVKHVSD